TSHLLHTCQHNTLHPLHTCHISNTVLGLQGEETSVSVSSERGYYVLGQVVSQVEDLIHEFKGHCSISIHDIQNMSLPRSNSEKRTQNSVSMYQQDHIEMSLKWTLERYTPPVSDSRYCVIFVPVFSSKTLIPTHHVEQHLDNERRNRPHYVASSNSCWCDRDAWAQQSLGKLPLLYVVEIHIRPWDPHNMQVARNPQAPWTSPFPPIHLTEANCCYFRQSCHQCKLCLEDVRQILMHRVHEHYRLKLTALHQQQEELLHLMHQHGVNLPSPTQ
ncbi:putative Schlafen-like, partial [Homarus americanus]